ncbi:RXLR domain-containing protein [Phytophthora infestans]|uniref:RxLR effector protein n=1 Tax=Phytophthora infestans TaxID=4787 RepID=A0A833W7W3_PHYIN|nr:RXLR domain-containing protein [Phytophthora infestans]KAF4127825.1 RXLR effector domain-containing protein [Phytophthora infestans]KAF4127826.1 RXLR effector domain-containing protein [Phytophthora infestans]
MRLFNFTVVALAAVLLASDTALSDADPTSVSNVDIAHTSHALARNDKKFLRSHQTTDGKNKIMGHANEERS